MKEIQLITVPKIRFDYDGKAEVLAACACPGILPARVTADGEMVQIYYDVRGWSRLEDRRNLSATDALLVVSQTLKKMESLRGWLFFPEEYVLSGRTVWISTDGREAKIMYIPDGKPVSEQRRLEGFLQELKRMTTENGVMYLETLIRMVETEHLNTGRVLVFIDHLMTEAHVCGIR